MLRRTGGANARLRAGAATVIVRSLVSGFALAVSTVMSSTALAECLRSIGAIPSLQGEAQVQAAGVWRPAALNEQLCPGDVIHVGDRSRAEVTVVNQPNIRLDQSTALHLPGDDEPLVVKLLYGAAYFFSRDPRRLTVDTPFIDAAVEGTEFLVKVEAERALIVVFEGRIRASNPHGELALASGEAALAEAGQAPTPYLIVRPRDAVQWTLFYPAILPALADPSGSAAQTLQEPLRGAVEQAAQGQLPAAFTQFGAIPETDRDSDYYLYRAAALLSVGRADEARADIGQALLRDPSDGRVDALSAVIAVARNDRDRALADAQRAVELSPRSAAAKIALSYAEQARFRIDQAREALQQAVQDEPENALAWARLSELWLMGGYLDRARRATKRARELAPELARVQTVLGFAELAAINTGRAKKAFRRAIAIDSANPLPRFGLGLATIRAGDLEQGRKEIEIAVALDPENALLRSYLGKAYFDERTTNPLTYFQEMVSNFSNQENTLAAQQFGIAKQLDPNDPTPWLYDAIRLQSENRPVEALRDLEESIELNDNRAVYRSRELLDQDRAARGASLARIYNDFGFQQLGINEATKSLSYDPGNAGAHRFLSDVYATQPRREIARVSELLQAQLLQDININPVQPSLADPNIAARGGPARPGFNEFTPLFERNRAQLNLSGVVGSEWTRGKEAVVSGIYDNISVSAGQFHYQTDGFRQNFNEEHNVYDLFAQAALTPEVNIQAEYWRRTSELGDRRLRFEPRVRSIRNRDWDQDSGRLGLRLSPTPRLDFLGSLIYSNRDTKIQEDVFDDRSNLDGYQGEAQAIFRGNQYNVTSGLSTYEFDLDSRNKEEFEPTFASHTDIDAKNIYIYTNVTLPSALTWTFGFSYDYYKQANYSTEGTNPKLGIVWRINTDLQVRGAAVRTVKPVLIANRTIQPTQVAGFEQFFDDVNGTKSSLYGIGLDARLATNLYGGIETTMRDLDEARQEGKTDDRDEYRYSAYLYWAPSSFLAINTGLSLDIFDRESKGFGPTQVETFSLPITVNYFHSSGIFSSAGTSIVHQYVNLPNPNGSSSRQQGTNMFAVVDAAIGYRLRERRGLVSFEARNIFNQGFNYQDESFREFTAQQTVSAFIPERALIARLTSEFLTHAAPRL